jgi:carbamate kinase
VWERVPVDVRVVVAVGGNALARRGRPMTLDNQVANVSIACDHLSRVASLHQLAITHGNGPQVGLLALEDASIAPAPHHPLDVLVAETQGMIGYLIERELGNHLPADRHLATLLTMVEVDGDDPSFADPSKPVGPPCSAEEADAFERERGWTFRPNGEAFRRVVPSPSPIAIVEEQPIFELLAAGCVVICAGGGGIATVRGPDGHLRGVEAVIDKDHVSGLLAGVLHADVLVLATDVDAVYLGFGTTRANAVFAAHPDALLDEHVAEFAVGSMLPKVTAACDFARVTGRSAMIGSLADIEGLVAGTAGTRISNDVAGVQIDDRGDDR